MKRLLVSLAAATAVFFAGSWIVVATIGNKDHGWQGVVGGIFWFGFLACGAALVLAALFALARSRLSRTAATMAVVALALAAAVAGIARAEPAGGQTRISFVVPIASVKAQDPAMRAGSAAPDYFREAWTPRHSRTVVRQDGVGFLEFREGTFLGTVTLERGQIVYAGTTTDQDDFQYAILGGSGVYAAARGTLTLHKVDRAHVRVTISLVA